MRNDLHVFGVWVGVLVAAIVGAVLLTVYVTLAVVWFTSHADDGYWGFYSVPTGAFIGAGFVLMGVGIWRDSVAYRRVAQVLAVMTCMASFHVLREEPGFGWLSVLLPGIVTPVFVVLLPRLVRGYWEVRGVVFEEGF